MANCVGSGSSYGLGSGSSITSTVPERSSDLGMKEGAHRFVGTGGGGREMKDGCHRTGRCLFGAVPDRALRVPDTDCESETGYNPGVAERDIIDDIINLLMIGS